MGDVVAASTWLAKLMLNSGTCKDCQYMLLVVDLDLPSLTHHVCIDIVATWR